MATMVSERQKRAKTGGAGKPVVGTRIGAAVRDLMTVEVVSLSPGDDLTELLDRMADEHIRHMPIVDRDGDLVGLVPTEASRRSPCRATREN